MAKLKFIDLFAGLGGFHLALEKLGCECVFASEIQPELQSLYERNFGMKCSGDINEIDITKDIPDHDILCAGFPCQPFSQAGKQQGFDDQKRRDENVRIYCKQNNIMLVEIPYTISSFKRVSEFLNKVVFENIDPSTLVDYNLLYETTKGK